MDRADKLYGQLHGSGWLPQVLNGSGDAERRVAQTGDARAVDIVAAESAEVVWQNFRQIRFDDDAVTDIELAAKCHHGRQLIEFILPAMALIFVHWYRFATTLQALNCCFFFDIHDLYLTGHSGAGVGIILTREIAVVTGLLIEWHGRQIKESM